MDAVAEIEDAFVAQWEYFGRWPKGELYSENGLVWFETPIKHLPYNGVIRTQAAGVRTEHSIADLVERFRSRQVDFVWIDHPSAIPSDLGSQLLSAGLEPVERMTGMALDLDSYAEHTAGAACRVEEVKDESELDTYTALALAYWEITDKHDGELISELHRHWGPGKAPGHRFMAHREGRLWARGSFRLPVRAEWPGSTE